MVTTEEINRLLGLTDHFEQRRLRASERLASLPVGRWHFGILGLDLPSTEMSIGEFATILAVLEPPGAVELAAALNDKSMWNAVARYSSGLRCELVINDVLTEKAQSAFNISWWIVSAIRAKTGLDLLVPAVADCSWSTIAGIQPGSCNAQLLEDVPRARRLASSRPLSEEDVAWVARNLFSFAGLLETPRFRLAVECLTTHNQEASLRMATASLWAGVEALFEVSTELRFRLAILIAAFLENRGPERIQRYRSVKRLYDFRSKVVHGAAVTDKAIEDHCRDAREVLSALVCKMTEMGSIPEGETWDEILLG